MTDSVQTVWAWLDYELPFWAGMLLLMALYLVPTVVYLLVLWRRVLRRRKLRVVQ